MLAASSRQDAVDSMIRMLPRMQEDSQKVMMLDNITFELTDIDVDKLIVYAREEFVVAKRIKWVRGMGMGCLAIALYHEATGNIDSCVYYNKQAIGYFEELKFAQGLGVVYSTLCNLYSEHSIFDRSIENGYKALKLFEEVGDKPSMARMHSNIAGAYYGMGQYDLAIKNFNEAEKEMIVLKDSFNLINVLNNKSLAYQNKKLFQQAYNCSKQALFISRQLNDAPQVAHSLMGISGIFISRKQYDSAIIYNHESYQIFQSLENEPGLADNLTSTGMVSFKCYQDSASPAASALLRQLYHIDNMLALADTSYTRAIDLYNKYGLVNGAQQCYEMLSQVKEAAGDYRQALELYRKHTELKDSISLSQNAEKIAEFETDRALQVKERQIQEDNRKSKERVLFISITLLLLTIIGIVIRNFYKQRKLVAQKQALADQKEKLADQREVLLKEKDVLIKEIHHRVKNNLQVVVSLLDLQTGNTSDELARHTMTESAARVKSISLIHRFLYQHDNITGIEFNNFAKELFTQVFAVFKKNGQTIDLSANIPETVLDIDTAVPLGLILNELLVNSFKYAFPATNGVVAISLKKLTDHYEMTYKDSGPGLKEGIDIEKATSTGMTIMHNLSAQLEGSIRYDRPTNTFTIQFKDLLGRKETL